MHVCVCVCESVEWGLGPMGIQDLISLFSGFISGKSGQKW